MRKLIWMIVICCHVMVIFAQKKAPKWMEKQRKAVLTVTTFGKDNVKKASGVGFFVSETGEALSAYSLFEDAERAVVTDASGEEFPVTRIVGADEMYDVIKFKVETSKKTTCLELAQEPLAQGANAYLMPFSTTKIKQFGAGSIVEVSKLKDPYSYYKLSIPLQEGWLNAPLLTEDGKVFGLAQEDASGNKDCLFAVSAGYVNQLKITSTDAFNTAYKRVKIKKAWPADPAEAQLILYVLANSEDAKTYLATLNDFIATFPNVAEGYLSRANLYAHHRAEFAQNAADQSSYLEKAMADMEQAGKFSDKKSDLWFQRAKMIYGVAVTDTTLQDERWSMNAAFDAIQKAIAEDDQPIYHQVKGDLLYYQGDYAKAFADYMIVNQSKVASSLSWYSAAKAKKNLRGSNIGEIINMLDSAIVKGESASAQEIGTYILERVDLRLKLLQYKEAVDDYNLYFVIMRGRVSDQFFYLREQAKFRNNDLEGALKDIQFAIRINPGNPNYHAEEASVLIRQKEHEKALKSLEKAIELAPDFASCYRLRGLCLARLERKAEAKEAFSKAKELGDPLAERMMKQYAK